MNLVKGKSEEAWAEFVDSPTSSGSDFTWRSFARSFDFPLVMLEVVYKSGMAEGASMVYDILDSRGMLPQMEVTPNE